MEIYCSFVASRNILARENTLKTESKMIFMNSMISDNTFSGEAHG